jgi:hypothetical protein
MLVFRIAFVRLFTRSIWRQSPHAAEDAFRRFSEAESDSGWQFLQAMRDAQDPQLRAYLFTNSLEEFRHAELFAGLSGDAPSRRPSRFREKVYDGNLPLFLARVHVAESNIYRQFNAYAEAGGPSLRDVVKTVMDDEQHHQENALDALADISGTTSKVLERRARFESFVKGWLGFTRSLHTTFVNALLTAVFYPALAAKVFLGPDR